jgi:hypothetical protein
MGHDRQPDGTASSARCASALPPCAGSVHGKRNRTQRGILRTFDTRLGTEVGSWTGVGALWETPDRRGRPPGSDLKSHANDRLSDRAQAGVVDSGVTAHDLVGVIDRDRFPLGGDPFGLFDNNP